jgi:hypothetical protein
LCEENEKRLVLLASKYIFLIFYKPLSSASISASAELESVASALVSTAAGASGAGATVSWTAGSIGAAGAACIS